MFENTHVFIDSGNQYFNIGKKWPNKKLDYERLLNKIATFCKIDRTVIYGTQIKYSAEKFMCALKHIGAETKFRQISPNSWYSWNVGIATDIVRVVESGGVDTIVIGVSDRSFAPILEWVKEQGIRVIAFGCNLNGAISSVADEYYEITEDLLEEASHGDSEATE
jgi:uncharacterized LabA/DUF88 family protein